MNVVLTAYKDSFGIYTEGADRSISGPFSIGERGYVSMVDVNDIVIDYQKPHKLLTRIGIGSGEFIYVNETEDEIIAKLATIPGNGIVQSVELVIGGSGPLSIPAGNVVDLPAIIPDDTAVALFLISGIPQDNTNIPFTPPRTYDFTAVGGLVSGILKLIF